MYIKKFSTILIAVSLCVAAIAQEYALPAIPARLDTPQKRIDYLAKHFWKNFRPAEDEISEQMMVDFLTVTSSALASPRKRAVKSYFRLVKKSDKFRSDGDMYIEKYLNDRRSPLYNEELFVMFLRTGGGRRSAFLLEQLAKNHEGTPAADFTYISSDGLKLVLSDNFRKSEYIMVVFYDESCENCIALMDELRSHRFLELASMTDMLRVLAVAIPTPGEEAPPGKAEVPEWCEKAVLDDPEFFNEARYFLDELPSIYLLDKDGIVLMKQTGLNAVEEKLNGRKITN